MALAIAACGEAPEDEATPEETADEVTTEEPAEEPAADFVGCMVTDEGGVDDKSFNQSAYEGLVAAADAGVIGEPRVVESTAAADFEPNVQSMVAEDCGIIVTV